MPPPNDADPPTVRPTAGARELKSRVRPLRAWAPRSRALTAEALALLGPAAAEASPARPLSLAAATTARPVRCRRRQWQPDGAGDVAAGPVAQTRATLALRVPVPALWPAWGRGSCVGASAGGGSAGGGAGAGACGLADVAVRLPPGLTLAATSRGLPDVRLELLDVLVSWGQREGSVRAAAEGPSSTDDGSRRRRRRRPGGVPSPSSPSFFGGRHHRIYPAAAPAAAFAVRGGALLLAHAIFPDAAARAAPLLALPAAALDVAAPLALALAPAGARALARELWGGGGGGGSCGVGALGTRGKAMLGANAAGVVKKYNGKERAGEERGQEDAALPPSPLPPPPTPPPLMPPPPAPALAVRLAAAAAHSAVHALRSLSPPAAALASAAWIWRLVEPNSLLVLRGAVALAAVSADYNGLRRDAALGRFDGAAADGDGGDEEGRQERGAFCGGGGGGGGLDAARRRAHRRAACRVAPFMRDLPEGAAPLAPVLAALGRASFAAALAVGGVPLSGAAGAVAGGGGGGGNGSPDCSSSSTAWLGWDPSPTLQMAVTVDASRPDAASKAHRHAASGLDRRELLELFRRAPPPSEKEEGDDDAAAAAGAAAAAVVVVDARGSSSAPSSPCSSAACGPTSPATDHIAFLDRLPLYGRPERACAANSDDADADAPPPDDDAAAIGAAGHGGRLVVSAAPGSTCFPPALAAAARAARVARAEAELALRAAWLLLAFAPFAAAGLPLLAAAAALTDRAQAREREALGSDDDDGGQDEAQGPDGDDDDDAGFWRDPARQQAAAAAWRRGQLERVRTAAARRRERERERQLLLQSQAAEQAALARFFSAQMAALRVVLAAAAALLELVLLLALGGDWMGSATSGGAGAGVGGGGGPFEAAALRLRRAAWSLLLAGCARSGAAIIKCGQWAAVRRDIFPDDLCDALSALHDAAPSHAAGETRRALERAFGGPAAAGPARALDLFESFDWEPVASGSIAQVHRAVLRRGRRRGTEQRGRRHEEGDEDEDGGDSSNSNSRGGCVVAVKVRHPGVARHIAMDFLLLRRLAALADRAPAWLTGGRLGNADGGAGAAGRGGSSSSTGAALPLVHALGQFSRTMAAQADLRVEAVHMMRFARDFSPFAGGSSSSSRGRGGGGAFAFAGGGDCASAAAAVSGPIAVPLPVAGMATAEVLVETFEPGVSVGRYLSAAVAGSAAHERRAREQRLERRRERAEQHRQEQQEEERSGGGDGQQQQQQQQQPAVPAPAAARRRASFAPLAYVRALVAPVAAAVERFVRGRAASWRRMVGRTTRRRRRARRPQRGDGDVGGGSARSQIVALFLESYLHMLLDTGFMHQDLHPGNLLVRARGSGGGSVQGGVGGGGGGQGGPRQQQDQRQQQQQQQQLVLLDFGLAEDLSPDVRRHFTSFLNHAAAGSPAHATRHLLRWSGEGRAQRCPPRARRALLADMAELFAARCDLSSPRGVDLDAVLGRTLALVRTHGVSLDASYALLCMGLCAVVRCARALDPLFNLADAAAPELLCRALTGRTLGGCAAGL